MRTKSIWGVFLGSLVLLLPVRLCQQIFLVDRSTGFYTDNGISSAYITAVLVAGVLLMLIMSIREKDRPTGEAPALRSYGAAVAAMFCGFMFLGESLYSLVSQPAIENTTVNTVLSVAGILAGAVILITAYDLATGVNHLDHSPFLGLFPPLWGCVCLVGMFITYTAVVNEVENFYDTCTVIFLLLFLFSYSKYMAGLEGSRKLFIYGFPSVLLAFLTGLPAFVLELMGADLSSAFPVGLHLLNLMAAFYVLALLISIFRQERKSLAAPVLNRQEMVPMEQKTEGKKFSSEEAPSYSWSREEEEACREVLGKLQGKEIFRDKEKSPYDEKF